MGKKLPDRPQWFRDMMARLRADRRTGDASPSEFLEHGADEIERRHKDGDPYLRSLAIADVAAYDRLITREQRDQARDEAALAEATRWIQPGMLADDVLVKLGLDRTLELGFGRTVDTLDASHDERLKALAQLEHKLDNANEGIRKRIDDLKRADDLAGDKPLRAIIVNPEDYGYGDAAAL
jgi:hypothetical protein